jgi:hypothetical protein
MGAPISVMPVLRTMTKLPPVTGPLVVGAGVWVVVGAAVVDGVDSLQLKANNPVKIITVSDISNIFFIILSPPKNTIIYGKIFMVKNCFLSRPPFIKDYFPSLFLLSSKDSKEI